MIIGKKTFISPVTPEETGDERIKALFRNRAQLHEAKIPSFTVYITEQAWNTFLQKADDEYTLHKNEASGVVLGHYLKDSFGEYVVGTHFEAGTGSSTSAVFCEISVQDQVRILQSAKEKGLLQVIWIHSHPSFGAFYSSVDYRTLKSMYYAPHQAGIVVDNLKMEYMGFKVRNREAYEFKNICLVNLDDITSPIHMPYGKVPAKIFYARSSGLFKKKVNAPVSLNSAGKNKNNGDDPDLPAGIGKLIGELKTLISCHDEKLIKENQYRQTWEIKIKEIEELLNKQFGELPYKDVAPCLNKLNEMRALLYRERSREGQAKLENKLNELLNKITGMNC